MYHLPFFLGDGGGDGGGGDGDGLRDQRLTSIYAIT